MKKIILFHLCSIITLSTIGIMCGEKRKLTLNTILTNDIVDLLTDAQLKELFAQQNSINITNNSDIPTTIELQNQIDLDFSSINTKEKYNDIFKKTKNLTVKITCNYKSCPIYRSGTLVKAYRDIRYHRAKKHYACNCDREHASSDKARNCIHCSKPRNTKQNKDNNKKSYQSLCAIIFDFNTVPTKQEFEKKAEPYKDSGERIGIVCDMCGKCIFTTYKCVYRNIDTHRLGCKRKIDEL